jgi:asparagine synthase (glutamine-hydrolysing)
MCGITGIYSPGEFSRDELQRSLMLLKHRGPDSDGLFEDTAKGLGLGHTRLAILDLSPLGHQPMHSVDGQVVIVFNGEIYNFHQLRTDLEQRGSIPTCQPAPIHFNLGIT